MGDGMVVMLEACVVEDRVVMGSDLDYVMMLRGWWLL